MRIITWNVNGIRAVMNKGFLDFFEVQDPDLLCLQETKAHPEQVEPILLHPGGRVSFWSSADRRGYSGTATFCRERPVEVKTGIGIRKFDSEGRFVITDHGDFVLYNVYFPNGGSGPERHQFKQEFLAKFLRHLQQVLASGREIILVGDYNIAHQVADVYDPVRLAKESGFLPEERAWFDQFLTAGFIDGFRYFHPEAKNRYTWWSYREMARVNNRGWRIDYICVSQGIKNRLVSCQILDQVEGSDHCPVVLELK